MKSIKLLAFIFSLFPTTIVLAQNYTPVSYRLPLSPSFFSSSGSNFDSSAAAFSTIASNGYGTWTTVAPEESDVWVGKWVLFGDTLTTPSLANVNKPVPSGVIAHGDFVGEGPRGNRVKVATNLQGRVRFVWAADGGWRVQGFDPEDLDITFSGIPQKQRDITTGIQDYGLFANGLVGTGAPSGDYRDGFDVAMDTKFLYIVWGGSVTVVDLATSQEATGFPKPNSLLLGMPTVACDVRAAPDGPTCLIVGLTNPGAGGGYVTCRLRKIENGQVNGHWNDHDSRFDHCEKQDQYFRFYRHVRIVQKSVAGDPTVRYGIYAIIEAPGLAPIC